MICFDMLDWSLQFCGAVPRYGSRRVKSCWCGASARGQRPLERRAGVGRTARSERLVGGGDAAAGEGRLDGEVRGLWLCEWGGGGAAVGLAVGGALSLAMRQPVAAGSAVERWCPAVEDGAAAGGGSGPTRKRSRV